MPLVPTAALPHYRTATHFQAHRRTLQRALQKKRKSLTPGWVVYGKRRHAEPLEEDVPPQLYPW
jgi:hypothetical protein